MAKLSARGHRILWQAQRTSVNTDTTWHYALRSDGKLLRRVSTRYLSNVGTYGPGHYITDGGHWSIARALWPSDAKPSERAMAEQSIVDQLEKGGYTVTQKA